MSLLELTDVVSGYGAITALKGVSFSVEEGEIVTLIGNNGAGKTTTLRTISGLIRPRTGQVRFKGRQIGAVPPHKIVQLGISQSPEGRGIFSRLSVTENLEMGAYQRKDELKTDMERVLDLFPRLRERRLQAGGTLSGGEQQMLTIGRAMMARPRLLLLDEPSMGLSPILTETIFRTILDINKQGTTILLVEQNAAMALSIAARGYVLESGTMVASDSSENLRKSDLVRKAYLGEE
ncbi:MAG: ATP-binding cassette domain-containing protein [Dehalococcoidia bacterium]|nr:ATP-binding cassette domain-containing protein [Dehalococcoidia bacterium]